MAYADPEIFPEGVHLTMFLGFFLVNEEKRESIYPTTI